MRSGCNQCRFNCAFKISFDERRKCFNQFWDLSDHAKPWLLNTQIAIHKIAIKPVEAELETNDAENSNKKKLY